MTEPVLHCLPACRRAMTLVEMLVAMLIAVLLAASVVSAFMMVLRMAEDRDIEFGALQNARHAIEVMSSEIKQIDHNQPMVFVGINTPLAFGDGLDQDGDGVVDEEQPNGMDDDGDNVDRHASSGTHFERPNRVGWPDLGDGGVDEDCVFHNDSLTYRVHSTGPGYDYDDITYYIGACEGRERTLLRNASRWSGGSEISTVTAPVAFDVMSFNCLYWSPNAPPAAQFWVESWDHSAVFPAPGFDVPAAVLVSVSVYADRSPIATYADGAPIRVVTLHTVVNVESVIHDGAYPRDP